MDLGLDQNNKPIPAFGKQVLDTNGDFLGYIPKVSVQFYGTPSYTKWIGESAEVSGAWMAHNDIPNQKPDYTPGHIINTGDAVGNILGRNAIAPKLEPVEIGKSLISIPLLFDSEVSPHSNYTCQGTFCDPKQLQKTIQQQPKAQ